MKPLLRQWLCWLVMVAGLTCLSGPFLLGFAGEQAQKQVVNQFQKQLEAAPVLPTAPKAPAVWPEEETAEEPTLPKVSDNPHIQRFYEAAADYNGELVKTGLSQMTSRASVETFPLDYTAYGIADGLIGTVEVPALEIELGLYLGANTTNMAKGLAVFGMTSVPLGRGSENCSIAGHRGWRGTPVFRNIQVLRPGDPIYLKTLWGDLEYRVCEIHIVSNEDNSWCAIREGRSMISLMTCHPYGQNYQRYIVFAELYTDDQPEIAVPTHEAVSQPVTVVDADGTSRTVEIDTTAIEAGAEEYGTVMSNFVILAEDKMKPLAIGTAVFVGLVGLWLLVQTVRTIVDREED